MAPILRRTSTTLAVGLLLLAAVAAPAASGAQRNGPAVAPYVDMTLTQPAFSLASAARATGVKDYTLAFVVASGGCRGVWGPGVPVSGRPFAGDIAALRHLGGDVIVSFGGAAGTELALACDSPEKLAAQYQAAISAYRLTSIDFDVEGAAVADRASIDRRSEAIAMLERAAAASRRRLRVSLTLPVLPSGLDRYGLSVVRSAIAHRARIDVVNVMTMDYGDAAAPRPAGRMGQYAIDAASATHTQLKRLYRARTASQLWQMVGVTPMIGVNDQADEVFGLADAKRLVAFARATQLGRLAFWSEARDRSCPGSPQRYAQDSCSSIAQPIWAFTRAFGAYRG